MPTIIQGVIMFEYDKMRRHTDKDENKEGENKREEENKSMCERQRKDIILFKRQDKA
jgi:hypothetical protein